MNHARFENYPFWIVVVCNLLSISIYAIGIFVFLKLGTIWLLLYLAYVLFLEIRLLKKSCVHCCYYGKACAFGRGILSSLFFKRDEKSQLSQTKITWLDILPDFLVSLVPLGIGIVLLIIKFDLFLFILIIILAILTSFGNGFVRGNLACRFCKQLDLGCPAAKLFSKK